MTLNEILNDINISPYILYKHNNRTLICGVSKVKFRIVMEDPTIEITLDREAIISLDNNNGASVSDTISTDWLFITQEMLDSDGVIIEVMTEVDFQKATTQFFNMLNIVKVMNNRNKANG